MDWRAFTVGWHGALVGLLATALPMCAVMFRYRAPYEKWLESPMMAVIVALVAGLSGDLLLSGLATKVGLARDSGLSALIAILWFVLAGFLAGRFAARAAAVERHRRGSLIADSGATRRASGQHGARLTMAGVAIAPTDETKHFKLIGTTGTGKSTVIRELLHGALARGDRAIIADPDGAYLESFHDSSRGDLILNPFDSRSARWNAFAEIDDPYDVEQLARALIPDHDGQDRIWRGYARTLLSALMQQLHTARVTDIAELYRLVTVAGIEELRFIVAGTAAQPFTESENARMFSSIRSVAGSAIAAVQYVAVQRGPPLGVRQWVRRGPEPAARVLFLPYQAGQIAALRSLISAWLRLAIFEAMTVTAAERRLWFVIDELDALGPIDGLKDALARLRKYGGRCVLGFQSIAQVSSTYGAGEAQTIVENCGNTLILRCSGSEGGGTSRFASRLIGDRELVRSTVSRSRPPREWRTSTTHSEQHVTEPAVLASQIEQLADLEGYLKLASSPAWMRVRISP